MKRFLIMALILGAISPIFCCTFKFKNDGTQNILIIQDESGNKTRHLIKVGETKTIPGIAAADNFFVWKQIIPNLFQQEFEVAEIQCGGHNEQPALITYTELQTALFCALTFPHSTQAFYVLQGDMERKVFDIQPFN